MSRVRHPIQPGDNDPRHGSIGGYTSHQCRCPRCTGAFSRRCQQIRLRRRKLGLPDGDPRHGTVSGYTNWSCRCERCRYAKRVLDAGRGTRGGRKAGS